MGLLKKKRSISATIQYVSIEIFQKEYALNMMLKNRHVKFDYISCFHDAGDFKLIIGTTFTQFSVATAKKPLWHKGCAFIMTRMRGSSLHPPNQQIKTVDYGQ